jgi:hypothetical protein
VYGLSFDVPHLELKHGLLIPLAGLIALLAPNSQHLVLEPAQPNRHLATVVGLALVVVLLNVGAGQNVEFIYFQF